MSTSVPPLSELEMAAKEVIWDAMRKETVKELTPRIVRQKIETRFCLESGSLDVDPYKSSLKRVIKCTVKEPLPPSDTVSMTVDQAEGDALTTSDREATPEVISSGKRKRKSTSRVVEDSGSEPETECKVEARSSPHIKAKSRSKKRLSRAVESDYESDSAAKDEDEETKTKKKRRISSHHSDEEEEMDDQPPKKPMRRQKDAPKKALKSSNKAFKTPEHVPTSDVEQDEPEPSRARRSPPSSPSSSKENQNGNTNTQAVSKPPLSKAVEESETELEDLIDEPPKKKTQGKAKAEPKPKTTEKKKRTTKSSAVSLTKDEETIKRLKSLVVACGVRKVWSKVFQTIDSPKKQIDILKDMLKDLGMTGRMSMEQAKAIKAKREFEEELAEVQQFEKNMLARSARKPQTQRATSGNDSDAEAHSGLPVSEDDDDVPVPPRKRLNNARASIAAFLDDQSDDE